MDGAGNKHDGKTEDRSKESGPQDLVIVNHDLHLRAQHISTVFPNNS